MGICLVCGKECEGYICDECALVTDIEELCNRVIEYIPGNEEQPGSNALWDEIASGLEKRSDFRRIARILAERLPSPRREYQQLHSRFRNNRTVSAMFRDWFDGLYDTVIDSDGITSAEKCRLWGLKLNMLYSVYDYGGADRIAQDMIGAESMPWQAAYNLSEFYEYTRRYDLAFLAIEKAVAGSEDEYALAKLSERRGSIEKRVRDAREGKKEYTPSKTKDPEAQVKYAVFMRSIGVEMTWGTRKNSAPRHAKKGEVFVLSKFLKEADFDSFVAFDFETTGLSGSRDSIIEIGAVKVMDGRVVESEPLLFQTFVKPYKARVSPQITELTGITKDDVKNAPQMWEAVPAFLDFAQGLPLVGFNNHHFDTLFLDRAARYSNMKVTNLQFDVYEYSRSILKKMGYSGDDMKLSSIAEYLDIENPRAHRALADALTTARIYLGIRDLQKGD